MKNNSPNNWWHDFFKTGWQQFHHYMKSPEQTRQEIDLVDQILQQYMTSIPVV